MFQLAAHKKNRWNRVLFAQKHCKLTWVNQFPPGAKVQLVKALHLIPTKKNWNLAQLYIHHQMPGQLSTVTAKVSCQWVILSPRRRAKIECWQLSLGRSKVPKDIENALEKEMDKLQSTTEASRALNSVIWCLKPLVCFWFEVPVAKVCTCAGRYRKGLGKRDGQDAVDDGGRVGIQFCCWV